MLGQTRPRKLSGPHSKALRGIVATLSQRSAVAGLLAEVLMDQEHQPSQNYALAQRSTTKRSAAKPKMAAKTRVVAATGKQSGVPAGLAGTVHRPQRQPGAVDTNLPYDLRQLPPQAPKFPNSSVRDRGTSTSASNTTGAHKRVSSVPTKTAPLGIGRLRFLRQPKLPRVVLYDQYDNAGANATLSATFDDFPTFNADLADDFVVPAGQTWNVESLDADGTYFNGSGPAFDWNVFIYTDNAGLPGTQVYSTLNQPVTVSGTTFTVNLTPAAVLGAGTYWIEIQANMDFTTQGEWGWTDRTVQSNGPAAWQNPGGGFGICPTWTAKLTCIPTASGPDQVYRLNGTTGGGCVVTGSIDLSDPTQVDRLFRSGIPQTCPASTSCATLGDGLPHHYDEYTFTNTTGATQCVTVDTNTACTGTNCIFTGAYLGSFDPN